MLKDFSRVVLCFGLQEGFIEFDLLLDFLDFMAQRKNQQPNVPTCGLINVALNFHVDSAETSNLAMTDMRV